MLSQVRFDRLLSEQTVAAKKVFAAVPISDAWHAQQIASELGRTGSTMAYAVVAGCLDTLTRCGLIQEVGRQYFKRASFRATPQQETTMQQPVQQPATPPAKPTLRLTDHKSPLDRMGELAHALKVAAEAARTFTESVEKIAVQIEDVALEAEERMSEGSDELKQLRQMRDTFRSLVGGAA